jgi:type II secretory pathway pseudopilin PulG
VAILIVLASVATFAVLPALEGAKNDKATLDMQVLEKAYKTVALRSGGEVDSSTFNMQMLVPQLEQGSAALLDPWSKPYQFQFIPSETGEERIQFFTVSPKGEQIVWPRR